MREGGGRWKGGGRGNSGTAPGAFGEDFYLGIFASCTFRWHVECCVLSRFGLDWIGLDERVYEINSVLVDRLFVMFIPGTDDVHFLAARSAERWTLVVVSASSFHFYLRCS